MAIGELFEFDSAPYRRKITSPFYSDAELAANIVRKRHNRQSSVYGAGAGIGMSFFTFGATAIASAASFRSYSIAVQKLDMLEAEWTRRGHAKIPFRTVRDRVVPAVMGASTLGLSSFVGGGALKRAKRIGRMRSNSDSRVNDAYWTSYDDSFRASFDDSMHSRSLVGTSSLRRVPSYPSHRGESSGLPSRHSESMYPLPPAEPRPEMTREQIPTDDAPPYSASASQSSPSNRGPDSKTNDWNEYWRQDPFLDERAPSYSFAASETDRSTSSLPPRRV